MAKLLRGSVNPGLRGHIGKSHWSARDARVARAVVAEKTVGAVHYGDIEIGTAIVIEVAPGYAFDEAEIRQSIGLGHLGECSVAVVVKELR